MTLLLIFVAALGIIVGLLLALLLVRHERRQIGDIDFTRKKL